MNTEAARRLKVRDRVMWKRDKSDLGRVTRVTRKGVTFRWDDGQRFEVRFGFMELVSRAESRVSQKEIGI